jgi:translocation and assembly module TamB
MSDSQGEASTPRSRSWWKYLLIACGAGWVLLGAATRYVTTDSFQALLRRRMVAELERVTGGRVELGGFHTVPFRLEVDVRNLTIHGREQPGEIPYAHVDRLVARMKLISVLGAEFGFRSLVLDRPVVHIITYPDGTTNQPAPKPGAMDARTHLERLFSFSISELEVRHGEALWNDQKMPLDFMANDIFASLNYSLLHQRYDGSLLLGKIDTKFDDYRPLAWTAEAHFELSRDSMVLNSLKATSGRSHLTAKGRMLDFREPNLVGEYEVTLDLAEAGAITHRPEMRRGTLEASGRGSWSKLAFSTNGTLQGKDVDWAYPSFRLQAPSFATQFTLNPARLALADLRAKLLGGEITGDAQVLNWQNSTPANKRVTGNEQRGSVRLRLRDLSAQEVAIALSSRARPLHRMNLAGVASGTLDTQWKGSVQNRESELTLDIAAPNSVSLEQLPLNAHVLATYSAAAEELQVKEFNASTRASQVRASGTLSRRAAVNFSLATSNFEEWERVLESLGYQEGIPFTMRGHASFSGTATGKLSEVDLAGRLQSQDFEVVIPASSNTARREIRWDSLAGDVQLSPHTFIMRNGTMHRGKAAMHFEMEAGLDERQFTDSSPFKAHFEMHGANAADVLRMWGFKYPVSGTMNVSLRASGTRASPSGQGSVRLSDAIVHGAALPQLDSTFAFSREQVSFADLRFGYGDGQVTGSGNYDFASDAFRFNLDGRDFDLTNFPVLESSRVHLQGRLDFAAQGSGTLEQPAVSAQIHVHELTFDTERAGDYTLDAVTSGSDLQITGRSQFGDRELNIDGNVNLRGDWPAKIDFRVSRMDVDPLLAAYLKREVTGHSAVSGDVYLQGPLRNPGELQVTGNLTDFFADVEHVQVHNNDAIRFKASGQRLDIERLRLIGEGTDLEIGGSVQLDDEHALNLNAEGHADLKLLHSFSPDCNSSGAVALNLMATGNLAHPSIQGRLQVSGGSVQYADLPSALTDLNGSLVFDQDRLEVETLTGHVGGGLLIFGGYATLYNRQLNFDLTLQGADVRLRYPQGISSMTTTQLRWAGTPSGSTLSGDATITKLAVTPGFDFSSYLQSSSQSAALPPINPTLSSVRLDVHITTTPQLQMQTAALSLSGDADLRLRGTAAKPVLLGRIDILEGQIAFNGTKYRLERGDITFTNPVTTTPVLDLQATTRLREYEVTVNLNGEFDKLNLTYHSEPPLATADIIGLLSPIGSTQQFGAAPQQTAPSPFAQQASSAVLAEALNSALSNRSQRLFGISHIKIDPQGLNTETTPTQTSPLPAVTIEQPVRENITLTYTTNLAQTSQQIIQGEYNITSRVSVVGLRDYNGVVSFELRLRQTKK